MKMFVNLAAVGVVCLFVTLGTAHGEGHWINLFDGETTFGWTAIGDAEWTVNDGTLKGANGTGGMLVSTSKFKDFELTARVRVKAGSSSGLVVRSLLEGHPTENGSGVIWFRERNNAKPRWRDIRVEALGERVAATIDGKKVKDFDATNDRGYIGLLYNHNGDATVEMSEMKLRPLSLHPIFDGKSLDGWNIIPGHRSEFSIMDGAINIKNGNGQIETSGLYKSFLLQLDVISNGDHLNSGVFFRGPAGVFWKGYESQVRNEWKEGDRSKPNDYGTGGNYGNQAARKVVSSDYEWFQKTVVSHDNHFAIWIDGYLASDFYDTRPVHPRADAKKGYVPGPGTIHLQGHDPTTDLSFRNIVIEDYDAAER
jgi:hypothetical protein